MGHNGFPVTFIECIINAISLFRHISYFSKKKTEIWIISEIGHNLSCLLFHCVATGTRFMGRDYYRPHKIMRVDYFALFIKVEWFILFVSFALQHPIRIWPSKLYPRSLCSRTGWLPAQYNSGKPDSLAIWILSIIHGTTLFHLF